LAELPDGKTLGLVNIYGLLESSPMTPEVKVVHYGIHRMLSDVGFWLAQLEEPKVDGFIVGGDLNKDRRMDGGAGFKTGRSIASNLLNRFSDFGLAEADLKGATTFTHSSSKSTWQIDHIFLSEHLAKRTAARVVTTNGINEHSDHSPIELVFE
jgi:endonuclease/exonuclease/phosphatase family metal-dependent hydrolase